MRQIKREARGRPKLDAHVEDNTEVVDRVQSNRGSEVARSNRQVGAGPSKTCGPYGEEKLLRRAKTVEIMCAAEQGRWYPDLNPFLRPVGHELLHQIAAIDHLFSHCLDRNDGNCEGGEEEPT